MIKKKSFTYRKRIKNFTKTTYTAWIIQNCNMCRDTDMKYINKANRETVRLTI